MALTQSWKKDLVYYLSNNTSKRYTRTTFNVVKWLIQKGRDDLC